MAISWRTANKTRATTSYVISGQELEVKVAGLFDKIRLPVLTGLLLGPRWGAASVALYLLAGACGLPPAAIRAEIALQDLPQPLAVLHQKRVVEVVVGADRGEGLRVHFDRAGCLCDATCRRFVGDIDHPRRTPVVEMAEASLGGVFRRHWVG